MYQTMLNRLLVIFITLSITACAEPISDKVRFGLASMPSNMDPGFATDAASSRIGRLLYQRLVDFDDSKQAIPSIATWQRLAPQHYRFTLNDKASSFSDNTLLTASDVKATYDFILNKKNNSPHRASLAVIEKIENPDEKTIDFYLNKPDPLFPGYLVVGIMPEEKLKNGFSFAEKAVGSGDFIFLAKEEDKIHLQRKSDNLLVDFIHVPNPTVRTLKLMRGEIDIIQNDLLPELVNFLGTQEDINISNINGSSFAYIGFNMQDLVLSQLNIRQAITFGIDRDEIIHYVFADAARKALSILPSDHWAGMKPSSVISYNPEKAKTLLAQSGYSIENPLHLTFKTSSDPFRLRLATIYQHQLKKIGIELDVRSYDWGTFYGDIKNGQFQLYSLAWVGIKTPDIFRYTSHSSAVPPNGANRGFYVNKQVDRLIESAEAEQQLEQQAKYYRQLQAVLLKDLPYMPLWYENNVVITRKNIKNYTLAADGNYDGLITVGL